MKRLRYRNGVWTATKGQYELHFDSSFSAVKWLLE